MARKAATTEGGNGPLPTDWSKDLDRQLDADLEDEARQVEEEFGPASDGDGAGPEQDGQDGADGETGEEGAMNGAPTEDAATLDAEDEARAAERDREQKPAELDRWVAEFKRGVEAASHSVEDVAWNTSGKVQAKLSMTCTLTIDDGKLALDCALSETVLTMKSGAKQSFCQTDMPIAAARRAAFYGHTTGQLRLMIDGVPADVAIEMSQAGGDDVPAEGALGEALAGAFGEDRAAGPEESADAELEPAEAVA